MRAHILGLGGVFMGNLALLLKDLGWQVTGSDGSVYPPMSDVLAAANIDIAPYDANIAQQNIDCFIVGNGVSRGNPLLEAILNLGLSYTSGPELLAREVLSGRDVLAVAGTHGKTTTTNMLVHIFSRLNRDIGYLVGGSIGMHGTQPKAGSRVGTDRLFVIEADEYDSAFCDKRAKFVHYRPRWAVLNNLEFDHADIYPNLAAIETQFHHLVRLIPENGTVIYPHSDTALQRVIAKGLYSQAILLGQDWQLTHADGVRWYVHYQGKSVLLDWKIAGKHNACNALAAIAATHASGADWVAATKALADFSNAARRLEWLAKIRGIDFYTDFAHHPTAIAASLSAMREIVGTERLLVILHPASNTMKSGVHKDALLQALEQADGVWLYQPNSQAYDLSGDLAGHRNWKGCYVSGDSLAQSLLDYAGAGDSVISLSNGNIIPVHKALLGCA